MPRRRRLYEFIRGGVLGAGIVCVVALIIYVLSESQAAVAAAFIAINNAVLPKVMMTIMKKPGGGEHHHTHSTYEVCMCVEGKKYEHNHEKRVKRAPGIAERQAKENSVWRFRFSFVGALHWSLVRGQGWVELRESALRKAALLWNVKTVGGGDWSIVGCERTSTWLIARLGGREHCYRRIFLMHWCVQGSCLDRSPFVILFCGSCCSRNDNACSRAVFHRGQGHQMRRKYRRGALLVKQHVC